MTNEMTVDCRTGEVIDQQRSETSVVRSQPEGGLDLLTIIEKRNKLLERILDYSIAATHSEQWFDLGGKPWPGGPACEAMARRCGVSMTQMHLHKRQSSDDKGDFYIYEATGTFSLPSGFDVIEALGTCSSRDSFLGTETSAGREVSAIDEGNIMKAAYSNCLVNGVTRLLGVRSISWERLAALGLNRGAMGEVKFKAGAQGGGQQASGSDLEMKFGKSKGKKLSELADDDLAWYLTAFERDVADPEKAKFKANAEKQVAAAKAEQARRANAKAGTETKAGPGPTVFDRVMQLCTTAGLNTEKAKELIKGVTKKGKPSELVETDLAAVADALDLQKKQGEEAW